jgi:ABC-type molybdate transport system substrate-binding protein
VAWLTFTPGYFDGSGPWGEIAATRVIYWEQAPGSLTDQQTAFDYVVLVMDQPIGDVVGYPGYRTYDDAWNGGSYWQYIGFPGELSSGERPAFQGKGVISTGGNDAAAKVADGKADIAIVPITDIHAKEAKLVGPLPEPIQLWTVYAAAIPNSRAAVTSAAQSASMNEIAW